MRHIFEAQMFTVGLDKHPYVKSFMDAYFNNTSIQLTESFDNTNVDVESMRKLALRAVKLDESAKSIYNSALPDVVKAVNLAQIILENQVIDHEGQAYKKTGSSWKRYNIKTDKWEEFQNRDLKLDVLPKKVKELKAKRKAERQAQPQDEVQVDEPVQKDSGMDSLRKHKDQKQRNADFEKSLDDKIQKAKEPEVQAEPEVEPAVEPEVPQNKQEMGDDGGTLDQPSFTDKAKDSVRDLGNRVKTGAEMALGRNKDESPVPFQDQLDNLDAQDQQLVRKLITVGEEWSDFAIAAILNGQKDEVKRILGSDK